MAICNLVMSIIMTLPDEFDVSVWMWLQIFAYMIYALGFEREIEKSGDEGEKSDEE